MNAANHRADYGSRDQSIRCQTYSPVRRLEGLPQELFTTYWRDVHGPLCTRLPGLGFYVQHHFSRENSANLWRIAEGVRKIDVVLDGAVEIGFANATEMGRFVDASPILFGDEINLFEWDAAYFLADGSRTFVDRQADATPNGPDRLHRLHVYLHGAHEASVFGPWVSGFASLLAEDDSVTKLRLHLPQTYDNANPQPPSPVDHLVMPEMTTLAVMELGFENALAARLFFDGARYAATLPDQAEHVASMAVFLVTGVYTYIRDGAPTLAGLRGSRAAEIIEAVGATNHLAPAVTTLFTRA